MSDNLFRWQGVSRMDAVAALLASGGNKDVAMSMSLQWQQVGSQHQHPYSPQQLDLWADQAEVQRVLQRFRKSGMQ